MELTMNIEDIDPHEELMHRMILNEISSKLSMEVKHGDEPFYRTIHPYIAFNDQSREIILACYQLADFENKIPSGYVDLKLNLITDVRFSNESFECRPDFDSRHKRYEDQIVASCNAEWIKASRQGDLSDEDFELFYEEMYGSEDNDSRRVSTLVKVESFLTDIVWYSRCFTPQRLSIESGETKIVTGEEFRAAKGDASQMIVDSIWEGALVSAARIEAQLAPEHLEVEDDVEWGLILGKLSAIRWVLGDEWDFLDT